MLNVKQRVGRENRHTLKALELMNNAIEWCNQCYEKDNTLYHRAQVLHKILK